MKEMIITWNENVTNETEDGDITYENRDMVKVVELKEIARQTTNWNGIKILFTNGEKLEISEQVTITYR